MGQTKCVTGKDQSLATALTWVSYVAKPGTPCVFGVDPLDEGKHCMDVGSQYYGSYGWCWTDKATTTWGICDESCPMVGHLHNLDQKIDTLNATVHKHHKDLVGSMKKLAKEAGVSPKVVEEAEEPKKEPAKKADVKKEPKKPEDAKKKKAAEAKDGKEEKAQDAEEKKM